MTVPNRDFHFTLKNKTKQNGHFHPKVSADTLSPTSTSLVSAGFLATTRIIYGDLDEIGPGIL